MTNLTQQTRNDYLNAWAKMMINIWKDRIAKLNIHSDRKQKEGHVALFDSFLAFVEPNANGDIEKITHTFNYYGRMVDMGVGRGVKMEDAGRGSGRIKKPWYNKAYYRSVKNAVEFCMVMNGESFLWSMNDLMDRMEGRPRNFDGMFD